MEIWAGESKLSPHTQHGIGIVIKLATEQPPHQQKDQEPDTEPGKQRAPVDLDHIFTSLSKSYQ